MDHNNFFNGTFDLGAYETTMDSSFYRKGGYRNELANYRNDNFDEDFLISTPSSPSNLNFYNAGSSFRKRLMQKPLNFDPKKSILSKPASKKNLFNDNIESSNKIPSIHRQCKNQSLSKETRINRILKNTNKGGSTARNVGVNQSLQNIPSLKQKLAMKNDLGYLYSSRNNLYDIGNTTIDLGANAESRNFFISPRNGTNETIFRLQRKVNELKELLAESQSQ